MSGIRPPGAQLHYQHMWYKIGRFNFLFMWITDRWIRSNKDLQILMHELESRIKKNPYRDLSQEMREFVARIKPTLEQAD